MKRWLAALLFLASNAEAAPTCDASVEAWVARCGRFELVTCHRGVVVVRDAEAKLDVELRPRSPESFRAAGELGLAPVGQFPDWSKESEPRRRALDTLAACAERERLPLERLLPEPTGQTPRVRPPLVPWRLLAGLILLVAALRGRASLLLLAIPIALARFAAMGSAYFHQNGQGPAWVGYAVRDDPGLAAYGPGFPELFALAARAWGSDPERGVWLLQALLAACVPPATWLIARRLGAGAWVAGALACACALEPVLARLAGTESYFSTIFSLTTLATLCCALPLRPRELWLPVGAAGLLLAQALRVHPVAWPAALVVPLPLLLAPGSLRRRARLFALGVALLGAIAIVLAGPALAEVSRGSLGQQWLPNVRLRWELLPQGATPYWLAGAVLLGALLRSWRGVVVATAGVAVIAAATLTDLTSAPNPAVSAAHQLLFLPAAVVLIAAAARRRSAQKPLAAALALATLLALPSRWALTRSPTDALEAAFVRELRGKLEGRVAYLERAGTQLSVLPLFHLERAPLREDDVRFELASLPGPAYYFRSSLCSTARGAPVCAELERSAELELVTERRLRALPSMRWNAYAGDEVRVALYRIRR